MGVTEADVAQALGLDRQTAALRLARLEAAGCIVKIEYSRPNGDGNLLPLFLKKSRV